MDKRKEIRKRLSEIRNKSKEFNTAIDEAFKQAEEENIDKIFIGTLTCHITMEKQLEIISDNEIKGDLKSLKKILKESTSEVFKDRKNDLSLS